MKRRKFLTLLGLSPFVAKFGALAKPVARAIPLSVPLPTFIRTWSGIQKTPDEIVKDILSMSAKIFESAGYDQDSTTVTEYIVKD